jgi:hypothetical protein
VIERFIASSPMAFIFDWSKFNQHRVSYVHDRYLITILSLCKYVVDFYSANVDRAEARFLIGL